MADPMAEVAPLAAESTAHLNRRESYDYREYRKQLHWWLLNFGNVLASSGEGYASRSGVWDAIESVKRNAPDAEFEETDA